MRSSSSISDPWFVQPHFHRALADLILFIQSVFNPATSLDYAEFVKDKLDIILLMSVNPGFGGQAFIPTTLDKAREARKFIDDNGLDCRLEIDGGVKVDNIKEVAEAGVDMMVAGSAILKEPRTVESYKETIDAMREQLAQVSN